MNEVYDTFIGYDNRTPEGVISGGSHTDGMPLNNLKDESPAIKARTTDLQLSSTMFNFYNGEDRVIRMWAICNHNFSPEALFRVRCSENSDLSSPLYDTGWMRVWDYPYGPNEVEWESNNFWFGQYQERELSGYRWHLARLMPILTNASYWRFEFDDRLNPRGFVEYGVLMLASGFQFGNNVEWGAGIGWQSNTKVKRSIGGNKFFDHRDSTRVAQFLTKFNDEDEAFGIWFDMQGRMGLDGTVFYMYDPTDTKHALRRQWLGTLTKLDLFVHPSFTEWETPWGCEESI